MADENTAVIENSEASVIDSPAFGNLGEAFDNAFPATADKAGKTDEQTELGSQEARKPEGEVEVPAAAAPVKVKEGEVPDAVFEDPGAVKPKPEVEVPEFVKKQGTKAIETWKDLRVKADTATDLSARQATEITNLKKQIETGATDEGTKARIAELEGQLKEMSDAVQRTNLEQHPAFQKRFVQPRKQLLTHAQNLVKEVGGDPVAFERAMALSGKQKIQALDELLEGIDSPTVKTRVAATIDQIDTLDQQAGAVLADAKGSMERLSQHSKAEQARIEEEQEQRFGQIFDATVDHLRDKAVLYTDKDGKPVRIGLEVLKRIEGADWWNKQGDGIVEGARKLMFKTSDPKELASAALLAASCGAYRALYLKERVSRIAAEKRNKEFDDSEPSLNGSRAEHSNGDETEGGSFAERVARGSGLR